MIRVFIADDHAIVRRGLRDVIGSVDDMTVAGEAEDGRAVLEVCAQPDFDVLVLDLSLPRVNGTEVLRRVKSIQPNLPVVVLSMYPEDQYALRLVREGAAAYLSKERSPDELLHAIREAAGGRRYLTQEVANIAVQALVSGERAKHETLTAREYQIFTLLFQGNSVSDIAAELDLTSSTVSNHVAAIRTKLGVRTIAEVVRYAVRAGLCD